MSALFAAQENDGPIFSTYCASTRKMTIDVMVYQPQDLPGWVAKLAVRDVLSVFKDQSVSSVDVGLYLIEVTHAFNSLIIHFGYECKWDMSRSTNDISIERLLLEGATQVYSDRNQAIADITHMAQALSYVCLRDFAKRFMR